jgi:chromosome segregation ATPase
MERKNKTICSLILFVTLLFIQGCSNVQNPQEANMHPGLSEIIQNDSVARRFQESSPQSPTAVESAIELSKKYAKLNDEASQLRQQNDQLAARNQQLRDQIDNIETQLQQTQKELAEANKVLIEMRLELNNWKSNVLGFRDEMRDAETAQLEALIKILHVLGGEVRIESVQGGTIGSADSAVASLGNSG